MNNATLTNLIRQRIKATFAQSPREAELRVVLHDGEVYIFKIALDEPNLYRLSEAEKCIIEVLNTIPRGEWMTGDEIALKAGYSKQGAFRRHLTSLAKANVVESDPRLGYRLTQPGHDEAMSRPS